ncbi:MAG: TldD/PmbA family protein [Candidatus Hydrothermarchaeales archaeon]
MRADEALDYLAKRADEAEIYLSSSRGHTLELWRGEMDLFKESSSSGYGVRVIKDKHMGFAYSNSLSEEVLNSALKVAKASERDPHVALPHQERYKELGVFDEDIADLDLEQAPEFVDALVAPCAGRGVIASYGSISWSSSEVEIWNTHGLYGADQGTWCSAVLSAVADDDQPASALYYDSSRKLDLDFAEIGRKAAELARSSLKAMEIGELQTDITLKPPAVADLVENVLIPSFSADNVQRGRSQLAGKIDEQLFSRFNIVDDGTLKNGLATSKFDGEGISSQKTELVRDGVLKGYLYDTYTAGKDGKESTGNAERDSYASLPYIDATNLVLSGRGKPSEKGLVVHGLIGAHTSNPVSGDFSVETRNAFLNGEAVQKAIISGNIFQLFKNIGGFGKDYRQVSSAYTPSIEFLDISVVG